MTPRHLLLGTLAIATTAVITACGGGDTVTETTISGSAVKGPVKGATVKVTKADGTDCGTTTTDSTVDKAGTYSLKTTCTGDLIVEVSGGSYTDEATDSPVNLNQLKAVVAANGGSSTVVVTPLTYLGYITAVNNSMLNSAGYTQAMQALAAQFKLSKEELAATPDITAAANAYGKVLRAFSQYVATQGVDYSLEKLMGEMGDKAKFAGTSTAFAAAFNKINETASPISFSFDGNALVISGTGAGGGSGTCGVTLNGAAIPISVCYTGLVGSCDSGNTSVAAALADVPNQLASVPGLAGLNLTYSFSPSCVANPLLNINLSS